MRQGFHSSIAIAIPIAIAMEYQEKIMNEPLEGATDAEPVSAPEVLPMS